VVLDQPLVCPVLIGREPFTRALAELRTAALAGAGRVVLISGEAGIGKSRLLSEVRAACQAEGWQVLEGNCFEQDQAVPYSAWTDLFRRTLSGNLRAEALRALGRGGGEIARLLPELADLPGLQQAAASSDPQQQKQRLIAEIEHFHATLAASAPLAVLIEDIHWADEATLELLIHAARKVASRRMLIVATYRSDEAGDILGHTLAELDRLRVATELPLDRLEPAEVREMLRATLDPSRAPRGDFAQTVYQLTEGNPFFIEEVLRSVHPPGALGNVTDLGIPRSVREAVRRRFQRLSGPSRRVAELAAVAGRRFDFDVLRRICDVDEAELLTPIKELVAAQLITEAEGDEFSFRHALTREAIYSGLLAREKRHIHRQIAETIEELRGEMAAADLAYHFFEAEEWAKALVYASAAAKEAGRVYAPRSAIEQYTRAIEAASRLGQAAPSELHRGRGVAFEAIGQFDRARSDYEAAMRLAQECGDRAAEWQGLIDLGLLWTARDYARAGEYYREAFALAEAIGDEAMRAHSMNRLGNWHINVAQPAESLQHHRQALRLYEKLSDKRGMAETLDLLGMSSLIGGDLHNGLTYLQGALPLFRELDDKPALSSALSTLTLFGRANYHTQSLVIPDYAWEEAAAANAESIAIAQAIGWNAAESYGLWNRAFLLAPRGRFSEAISLAKSGLALAEEIEHTQWQIGAHFSLGAIYWDILALEDAEKHLRAGLGMARSAGTAFWIKDHSGFLTSTLAAAGRFAEAHEVLDAVLTKSMPARMIEERLVWCGAVDLYLAERDLAAALHGIEQLRTYALNVDRGKPGPRFLLLEGQALTLAGRAQEAVETLERGVASSEYESNPGMLWRVLIALGHAQEAAGLESDAGATYQRAVSTILSLLPAVPEEHRQSFLSRSGAGLPPAFSSRLKPSSIGSGDGSPLTPRERAVTELVAQGKSNRAIAEELVLSERTVETHVSNILGKLGFTSRAQIVAWAVENRSR
jgi:DNA-binding CsgD family transcriptional regulator/tetratricopeptide (TPR) repeat protein